MNHQNLVPHIDPVKFDKVVQKLRDFFRGKGFIEAYTQNRLSILAACEDPGTISCFDYVRDKWPLIQTNQMWLEHLLLKDPSMKGLYCLSTSYRHEPNPIPGRHDLIFPLFEFESKGDVEDLIKLESELLQHLGFGKEENTFPRGIYSDLCKRYDCSKIDAKQEKQIKKDFGPAFFLTEFPEEESFWNMRRKDKKTAYKVDVILDGMETIGSAERSCDAADMLKRFKTISDGKYSELLYQHFGEKRVLQELNEYLNSYNFVPRFGGGIGMTRLISAMEEEGLL